MPTYTIHHQVNIDDLKYYCFWCEGNHNKITSEQRKLVSTYIEFDLALHLYETHKLAMVKLPIGKGNMDIRIAHAVEHCKAMTLYLRKYPERWIVAFNSVTEWYRMQQEERWQREQRPYQYQQIWQEREDEFEERESRED